MTATRRPIATSAIARLPESTKWHSAYAVPSRSSDEPHRVTVDEATGEYRCDDTCLAWHYRQACAHVDATRQYRAEEPWRRLWATESDDNLLDALRGYGTRSGALTADEATAHRLCLEEAAARGLIEEAA